MAKITIAGDAVVVTSTMKLEDIRTIEKYRPSALNLMGGEDGKEVIFAMGTAKSGTGSINEYGASFVRESNDEEKLATITMFPVDKAAGDIKEQVADKIGGAVMKLRELEETLPAVLREIAADKAAIMENITVAQ